MVKALAVALVAAPMVAAFVAPAAKVAPRGRSVRMNFGYEEGVRPVGGVQFFPSSAPYWDPLNLSKGGDDATIAQYQAAEIKHGRIAMLACLDYFHRGLGSVLPGNFLSTKISDIPVGLGAIKGLPAGGWAQIIIFASILELLTPQSPSKVPGNVQPDTESFPVPGDVEIRTKEINNGRLAMISILGIWVGELVSGGENPLHTFAPYAPGFEWLP